MKCLTDSNSKDASNNRSQIRQNVKMYKRTKHATKIKPRKEKRKVENPVSQKHSPGPAYL